MELWKMLWVSLYLVFGLAMPAQEVAGDLRSSGPIQSLRESNGLSDADWSSIRAAHEAHQHAIVCASDRYEARNPGQRWGTEFDGRGFHVRPDRADWTWGLELKGWGFSGNEVRMESGASVRVDGQRVTYDWSDDLSEWWINDRRGLEHGFTVHRRPATGLSSGTGSLLFTLAVRGPLLPVVTEDGRSVSFLNSEGTTVLTYSGLVVFDADHKILSARLEVVGGDLRIAVDERGARYPLTIDPIAQGAYLKASNTDSVDFFGKSVAVSGSTVVVGAPGESSGATGVNGNQFNNSAPISGAVYVFVRSGSGWMQQAYIKASNTFTGYRFGQSVSISGDTLVVGSPGESSSATGVNGPQSGIASTSSGAAYVFVRSGTVWIQQAYLKASNTDSFDGFGEAVSISGNTIVVGAPFESSSATGVNGNQLDNSAPSSGAAYVFVRSAGTWSQQAYLKASNTDAGDIFGGSVSISADTILVGASLEGSSSAGVNSIGTNNGALGSGASYVFRRVGSTWVQEAYLKASNTDASDQFGSSVSVSGETVVVGAMRESSNATGVNGNQTNNSVPFAGAAYVFVRSGSTWTQEAYLKASNPDFLHFFGNALCLSGDTLVVGARGETGMDPGVNGNQLLNGSFAAGAAYLFVRRGTTWAQQAYIKASNPDAADHFGDAVALDGETLVVGAWWEDSGSTGVNGNQFDNTVMDAGAVYDFQIPQASASAFGIGCSTTQQPAQLDVSSPMLGGGFVVNISYAAPLAQGMIFMGIPAPTPISASPTCNVYLTFPSLQAIQPLVTSATGAWSTPYILALDPNLAGLQLDIQAAIFNIASPLGLDLTNGLSVVLGY